MLSHHLLPRHMSLIQIHFLMQLMIMAGQEARSRQEKALHTNFTKEVRESSPQRNARQIHSLRTGAGT